MRHMRLLDTYKLPFRPLLLLFILNINNTIGVFWFHREGRVITEGVLSLYYRRVGSRDKYIIPTQLTGKNRIQVYT